MISEQDILNNDYQRALDMRLPFYMIRPRVFIDGNQWCCLYGDNLQDGVAGFGNTPEIASYDFDNNWLTQRIAITSSQPTEEV